MKHPIILPLKSVYNPRDLGGYYGVDHRQIKRGKLLRTGKIDGLSRKDQAFLVNELHLKQIIDLRSPKECQHWPDPEIPGVKQVHVSISDQNGSQASQDIRELRQKYHQDQYAGFKNMCHTYRDMVIRPSSQQAFHTFLVQVAANKSGATLYHCSEGKDRTGLCTVFLLDLLGVDFETIRADYLYSNLMLNAHLAELDQKLVAKGQNDILRATVRSLGSVANEYLDTALLLIKQQYGGLAHYLHNQIGVAPTLVEQLRDLYLESVLD